MTNSSFRHFATLLLVAAAVAAVGCSGKMEPIRGTFIAQTSGDGQEGIAGQPLADPIAVAVTEDEAAAVGVTVIWTVTAGGGEVVPSSTLTDADGHATALWVLGPSAGAQSVQAAVEGANGSPVTFTATAVAQPDPPPASAGVTVRNNNFLSARNGSSNPAVDTLQAGGTVTWTWAPEAAAPHNVTSAGSPGFPASETASLPPPYSVTLTDPGTYTYYCTIHGSAATGMRGRIVVR